MSFLGMFAMHAKPQLKELYMSIGIFSFASSLVAIFEPIFLYNQGFPIWAIAIYYAIHYSLYAVLLPFGGKVVSRFGLERSLICSLPFYVLYFISLASMPEFPLTVLFALVFLSLFKILYWPAYYGIFARFSDADNRGTELSWLGAFQYGGGILGPVIGGAIATVWGFPALFLSAGALVLLSGLPLMRMKHTYRVVDFPYTAPWNMLRRLEYRNTFIATIGWGENLIDVLFWPLFLFLTLGSLGGVGVYLSLSLVVMAIVSFFIGDRAEKYNKGKLVRMYLPFMVIGYLLRIFAVSPLRILFIDSLGRISLAGVVIPFMYKVYSQAKGTRSLEFVVAFEIVLAISKTVAAILIACFFILLPVHFAFTATFSLAIILSLFYGKL